MLTFGPLPVPWNASWSGEQPFSIRPCRWAGGRWAIHQPFRPGVGRPLFAKPHFTRQRQSVARCLCTVCGERAPAGDRWWFGHWSRRGDHVTTPEAPVHRKCAELALTVCPHLKGKERDLAPFPDRWGIGYVVLGGEEFERDFGLRASGREVIGAMTFAWPESSVQFKNFVEPSEA